MTQDRDLWDLRSQRPSLHAVFTERWSPDQCEQVDHIQREAIAMYLPAAHPGAALDLGCGIGRLTGWLASQRPTWHVTGVDVSDGMLARAADAVTAPNVAFRNASATNLPMNNQIFDLVVTVAVLQHLTDDSDFRTACAEITRVLKPSAHCICIEGIGAADTAIKATATSTRQRSIEQYRSAFGHEVTLQNAHSIKCIDDSYTVMSWKREPGVNT